MHFLVQLVRNDAVLHLLFLCLDLFRLLELVLEDEVEYLSSIEDDRYDLEVGLCVDAEEVEHDVFAGDAVDHLVDVLAPLADGNVALRKLLAVENQSDHPQNLVAEVELRLLSLEPLDRVRWKLINLLELLEASRIGVLCLLVQFEQGENHVDAGAGLLSVVGSSVQRDKGC